MAMSETLPESCSLFCLLDPGLEKRKTKKQKIPHKVFSCQQWLEECTSQDARSKGGNRPPSFFAPLPENKVCQIHCTCFASIVTSLTMIRSLQVCSRAARGIPRETTNVCTPCGCSCGQPQAGASSCLWTSSPAPCAAPEPPVQSHPVPSHPNPSRAPPSPLARSGEGSPAAGVPVAAGWKWEGAGPEGGTSRERGGESRRRAGLRRNAPRYKAGGRAAEREEWCGRGGRAGRAQHGAVPSGPVPSRPGQPPPRQVRRPLRAGWPGAHCRAPGGGRRLEVGALRPAAPSPALLLRRWQGKALLPGRLPAIKPCAPGLPFETHSLSQRHAFVLILEMDKGPPHSRPCPLRELSWPAPAWTQSKGTLGIRRGAGDSHLLSPPRRLRKPAAASSLPSGQDQRSTWSFHYCAKSVW